jgi:hypothetical protein
VHSPGAVRGVEHDALDQRSQRRAALLDRGAVLRVPALDELECVGRLQRAQPSLYLRVSVSFGVTDRLLNARLLLFRGPQLLRDRRGTRLGLGPSDAAMRAAKLGIID